MLARPIAAVSLFFLATFFVAEKPADAFMPFVIPPSIPGSRSSNRARDVPIPDDDDEMPSRPTSGLEDCPPGCVEGPGCTDACKCKNTFRTVHEMCNPPSDAEVAKLCSSWYRQCPMYKPVHF